MHRRSPGPLLIILFCAALTLLWIPGVKYPVVSDTVNYALLGRSLWLNGMYELYGQPYANHLPLHPFLSFPLIPIFGFHLGMHVTTLLAGFLVLIATFLLTRRVIKTSSHINRGHGSQQLTTGSGPRHSSFCTTVAALTAAAVLLHPSFILMSMLGSADLLFATLFLFSLFFFLKAEDDERWYLAAGITAGLSCLTRYNGLPLFPLFLFWTWWARRKDLTNKWFGCGIGIGIGIASMWFFRNYLVFGNAFHSNYTAELAQEAPNPVVMFFRNILYYGNPIHNVFPFLFLFALIGLRRHAKHYPFIVLAMLAGFSLSMIWWVQAIRFMFPGFVLLLFFAVLGLIDVFLYLKKSSVLVTLLIVAGISLQSVSVCLYTYGECNAWFDNSFGFLPKNMGLTPEGFYAWHKARNYINEHGEQGATVYYEQPEEAEGVFRPDFRMKNDQAICPAYKITQRPAQEEEIVFETEEWPVTAVVRVGCF